MCNVVKIQPNKRRFIELTFKHRHIRAPPHPKIGYLSNTSHIRQITTGLLSYLSNKGIETHKHPSVEAIFQIGYRKKGISGHTQYPQASYSSFK